MPRQLRIEDAGAVWHVPGPMKQRPKGKPAKSALAGRLPPEAGWTIWADWRVSPNGELDPFEHSPLRAEDSISSQPIIVQEYGFHHPRTDTHNMTLSEQEVKASMRKEQ